MSDLVRADVSSRPTRTAPTVTSRPKRQRNPRTPAPSRAASAATDRTRRAETAPPLRKQLDKAAAPDHLPHADLHRLRDAVLGGAREEQRRGVVQGETPETGTSMTSSPRWNSHGKGRPVAGSRNRMRSCRPSPISRGCAGRPWIDVDAEPPAHRSRRARRVRGGVLDPREERRHLLIEAAPLVREHDRARGAIEQPHADALLQPRRGAADAGLREPERPGRAREAPGLDHGREHADAAEETVIERHGVVDFPSCSP